MEGIDGGGAGLLSVPWGSTGEGSNDPSVDKPAKIALHYPRGTSSVCYRVAYCLATEDCHWHVKNGYDVCTFKSRRVGVTHNVAYLDRSFSIWVVHGL